MSCVYAKIQLWVIFMDDLHMEDTDIRKRRRNELPAFDIDDRIILRIESELAVQLGHLILDSETSNSALLALGHQLRNKTNAKHCSNGKERSEIV